MKKISETGGKGSSWDYCKAFQIQRCAGYLLAALAKGCGEAAYHSPTRICVSKQLTSSLMASKIYLGCYFFLLFFFFYFFYIYCLLRFLQSYCGSTYWFSFSYFARSDFDTAKYALIPKVQTQWSSNPTLKALSGHCKCSSLVNTVACWFTKCTKLLLFPMVSHSNNILASKWCNPRVLTWIVLVYLTCENVCNLTAKMYSLRKEKC